MFESVPRSSRPLRLTRVRIRLGSAGTLGAGDCLKERYGTRIVAVEALECPTMLENGFGEHNIQGIGDKHIPLIHNVMNTDFVIAVSDGLPTSSTCYSTRAAGATSCRSTQRAGHVIEALSLVRPVEHLQHRRRDQDGQAGSASAPTTRSSPWPRTARAMYGTEREPSRSRGDFAGRLRRASRRPRLRPAPRGAATDNVIELTAQDRKRIFNLGYYTWVEQQGVAARRVRGPPRPVVLARHARPAAACGTR